MWKKTEYKELKEGDEIRVYAYETVILGKEGYFFPGIVAKKDDATLVIKQGFGRFVEVTRDCIFERKEPDEKNVG